MIIPLIGQVYSVEKKSYVRNGEQKSYVAFRLGMDKPYKKEKEINGEIREVREKTFITVKCFNGLSDTIVQYFGGEENKGRWIQMTGHLEETEYDKVIQIDHPDDPNSIIETTVRVRGTEYIMNEFRFIGDAPTPRQVAPKQGQPVVKVKPQNNITPATMPTSEQISNQLIQQASQQPVVQQPAPQVIQQPVQEQVPQQPVKNIIVNDENTPF